MAYEQASLSPDPSTKVGAVLVSRGGVIIGFGYNRFPKGIEVTEERLECPLKYQYMCHAERNCLASAAKNGRVVDGSTMYCPWAACTECAKAIIESGVERIVTHKQAIDMGNLRCDDKWHEDLEFATQLMHDAGVGLYQYDGVLFHREFKALHSGRVWNP